MGLVEEVRGVVFVYERGFGLPILLAKLVNSLFHPTQGRKN